jgi:hypothetical protein
VACGSPVQVLWICAVFISAFIAQNIDFLLYYKRDSYQFLVKYAKWDPWVDGENHGRWI